MRKGAAARPRQTRRAAEPSIHVTLDGNGLGLRFDAGVADLPDQVGLVLDGALLSMATVERGEGGAAATLPLPEARFGQWLGAVALPEGRALGAPVELSARRRVEGLEWTAAAGRIAGGFRLAGDLAPESPGALPVEIVVDGVAAHTCVATEADGAWSFACPVPRLAGYGSAMILRARVAGLEVDGALRVSRAECGFAGQVDPTEQPVVQGWLVDALHPERRAVVEVAVQGRVIFRGEADMMRPDLRDAGIGDGASAFEVRLPRELRRDVPVHLAVTVAGTGMHLVNSPMVLPPLPPVMAYFDALEGPFAGGWAVNMRDPDDKLVIEAVCDGAVVGRGTADLYRGDVEKAGLPTARCGFRFLLERPLVELFDRDIVLRIADTGVVLNGSPRHINQNSNISRFLTRRSTIPPPVLERLSRQVSAETAGAPISIVMPVHNTRRAWLVEAINSVLWQWSANWELICVDDGSTEPHVAEVLREAERADKRVRVIRSGANRGIAAATNLGLRAARGAFVAFMDHDDTIEPDAVQKLARAALRTGADLVYSDEAITTDDVGSIIEVRARPAFSHDYYLSHPYFVHMVAVRTELAHRLHGWDEELPISADVDFVLRAIEQARVVAHVPSVLYRWRTHGTSAGHAKQALVTDTMLGLLDGHLRRMGLAGKAAPGLRFNEYRIDWEDDGGEVLIVIPTKNRTDLLKTAIDSIEATSAGENYRIVVIDHESKEKRSVKYLAELAGRHTVMPYSGPFNYALMNNLAVKEHAGKAKYLLFLNNDVEAREAGWIGRMRSLAARADVGAVGCLLLYGDDRVQHGGVLVGFNGAADHAMKFQDAYLDAGERHPGYNCSLTSVRDYSAVTAACMMVKRAAFRAVKGFDERFMVGFNDTDLCLRIGDAGYKVLYDGQTVLYHHESATRTQMDEVDHPEDDALLRARWRRFFTGGDPFYSPLLAAKGTDHTMRQDDGCRGRQVARAGPVRSEQGRRAPEKAPGKRVAVAKPLRSGRAAGPGATEFGR